MDDQRRRELALWRYSILGPIVSARLEHGDRKQHFERAAAREWEHPDGRSVRVSARTIEDWYYRWLEGGLEGLMPTTRSDAGTTHIEPEIRDLLIRAKREKPTRSIPQMIKILERAKKVPKGALSRSTVHRVLARVGLNHQPARASKERRSFLVEGVGDLGAIERWHRTWREEVGHELPEEPLTLAELNAKHWAWLEVEYHGRRHSTTGRVPREHFLAEADSHRPVPRGIDLREVFLRRERRKVRADGTVQLCGRTWEVPSHLSGRWVELRVHAKDSTQRPRVYFEGKDLGEATLLDLYRNATRRRRRSRTEVTPTVEPTGLDPLGDLERVHYRLGDPEQED